MPTGILFGQVLVVLGVALSGVWAATQWTAESLGYQVHLAYKASKSQGARNPS